MTHLHDPSVVHEGHPAALKARQIGIDSHEEMQVFLHKDCVVARSEGFSSHARVLVAANGDSIVAILYLVTSDLVGCDEAGFSEAAWERLRLSQGVAVRLSHAPPLDSMSGVRSKVYGNKLQKASQAAIISDVAAGRYSNIHLAAFITACAARPLDLAETCDLTRAMVDVGETIRWGTPIVADKHSVGGLPGNRTTPIVVAIAAACGLTIPKTSSRAITSPAGTADMMETLAPVDLDLVEMRDVVEREGGCLVWGGAMGLSPTDDILIRVERVLDLDAEGQLVASVLSKKIAAGSTHVILDMPVGPTAKVRTLEAAHSLTGMLMNVGSHFGLSLRVHVSDGAQPVGRGIGPSLEAHDVLAVLQNAKDAPGDLRERALALAAQLLELATAAEPGGGHRLALETLTSGRAWRKFQNICEAQGGMREPPVAPHHHVVTAAQGGVMTALDNRLLAKIAKLAGAPEDKAAGIALHVRVGDRIEKDQPLYTIHAESTGELGYALNYAAANPGALRVAAP
jgi:thymidine phosphorylase